LACVLMRRDVGRGCGRHSLCCLCVVCVRVYLAGARPLPWQPMGRGGASCMLSMPRASRTVKPTGGPARSLCMLICPDERVRCFWPRPMAPGPLLYFGDVSDRGDWPLSPSVLRRTIVPGVPGDSVVDGPNMSPPQMCNCAWHCLLPFKFGYRLVSFVHQLAVMPLAFAVRALFFFPRGDVGGGAASWGISFSSPLLGWGFRLGGCATCAVSVQTTGRQCCRPGGAVFLQLMVEGLYKLV